LKSDFEIPAPIAHGKAFSSFHRLLTKNRMNIYFHAALWHKNISVDYIYRFQKLVTLHLHRQFLVIVFLVVLADLVVEKVLFIGERLTAADIFQEKQSERGGYYVSVQRY
jgi:hypothetical protein